MLNKDKSIDLLEQMLQIRTAEEQIVAVYAKEQTMRTPTHLSIGQEAVAAGLAAAMHPNDQIFTGHRCHAAYLAKGGNYDGFFAELCGRQTGVAQGRSGSAHLTDHRAGIYASPILGAMIPVAVGAAMSFKMDQKPFVAVSVFGDGAIEEGVFAESLNFAMTKKLPVLFLCENNLYSTHSPLHVRQPQSTIADRMSIPGLFVQRIDGNDVESVYTTCDALLTRIRATYEPAFIECLTYRVREHVGPLFDYDRGYRSKEEVDAWMAQCPIERYTKVLEKQGIMTREEILAMKEHYQKKAAESYRKAINSDWPNPAELLNNVY